MRRNTALCLKFVSKNKNKNDGVKENLNANTQLSMSANTSRNKVALLIVALKVISDNSNKNICLQTLFNQYSQRTILLESVADKNYYFGSRRFGNSHAKTI